MIPKATLRRSSIPVKEVAPSALSILDKGFIASLTADNIYVQTAQMIKKIKLATKNNKAAKGKRNLKTPCTKTLLQTRYKQSDNTNDYYKERDRIDEHIDKGFRVTSRDKTIKQRETYFNEKQGI